MKKAIIIGCNGQDGKLLSELLRNVNYEIIGLDRGVICCPKRMRLKKVDICISKQVFDIVKKIKPDEIYHLAAFHHSSEERVAESVGLFDKSYRTNVLSLVNFLEAIRTFTPRTKLFYAASSHIFGNPRTCPQDESTPINPICIYGITKAAGLYICRLYRHQYSLFASTGILYNHESILRNEGFVSKKIIKGAINIKRGRQKKLILGNLNAIVDFGYAPDYVNAMHKILSMHKSDDFIVATGEGHSILDFVKAAFKILDLDWKKHVTEDNRIIKKNAFCHIGNSNKLRLMASWKPSIDFGGMIRLLLSEEWAFNE